MGLRDFWKNYRIFIVTGTGMVLIHWGWYKIKSNPLFQPKKEDYYEDSDIVRYVLQQDKENEGK
ncbi:uncharacterized LOC128706665 homolog [Pantherophis guttatus]|uniref:Uncharacterized LOC128706665 homolog n=2 Tax=Colubrinae TaxID=169863 RepID=A0ABM3ZAA7_PANGU|nr:uncharacterized LOC128706665 homolog [Pantherophis guttatus]XP_060545316.1 uncharacterized LOC128706665 homolog [Pantherophis guttatus]XP_060545317.1 uncharacterized LOC128706665 homolog [Pantherophis guttatus]XP_060545318.1 uncharacterized LOC128706665 homolog [Pantherophis guttatus]